MLFVMNPLSLLRKETLDKESIDVRTKDEHQTASDTRATKDMLTCGVPLAGMEKVNCISSKETSMPTDTWMKF